MSILERRVDESEQMVSGIAHLRAYRSRNIVPTLAASYSYCYTVLIAAPICLLQTQMSQCPRGVTQGVPTRRFVQ